MCHSNLYNNEFYMQRISNHEVMLEGPLVNPVHLQPVITQQRISRELIKLNPTKPIHKLRAMTIPGHSACQEALLHAQMEQEVN